LDDSGGMKPWELLSPSVLRLSPVGEHRQLDKAKINSVLDSENGIGKGHCMYRKPRRNQTATTLLLNVILLLLGMSTARGQDAWDAVFLGGNKIGYYHTFVEKVNERQRELYRVRLDMVLNFRRGDDTVVIKMMYGTIETPDGEVLRLDTRTLASDNEIRVYGDAVKGKMTLALEGTGQTQEVTIPWGKDVRGPYAAEQSMARKPMQEGETRTLKMYIPDLNKVCDITLKAGAITDVPLGDGSKRPLRKIEQTGSLDGKPRSELNTIMWVDPSGQVLKSETDLLGGMVMYRTTREGAIAPVGRLKYDQIRGTVIKVAHLIPNPERVGYVKYRLTLKDEDPAQIFPADNRQTIQPGPVKNTIYLEVRTSGPTDGQAGPVEVDPRYLQPNGLVTSEDEDVQRLAKRAVGKTADPWQKAVRIERWVFENIKHKNFETTFAPASEVARNLTGDCTEHAVLVAAMCRAIGIPSRCAVGLLYRDERLGGFGFHMWTEVYVNQRWVALDASWDQSSVDAAHIKLTDTSLDGVSPFESFLSILRVQGKLEIDPIEFR
jgi:hypothetical protein